MNITVRPAQTSSIAVTTAIQAAKEKAAQRNKTEGWAVVARVDMADPDLDIRFDAGTIMSNGERFFYATPRREWDNAKGERQSVRTVTVGMATSAKVLELAKKVFENRGVLDLVGTPTQGGDNTISL